MNIIDCLITYHGNEMCYHVVPNPSFNPHPTASGCTSTVPADRNIVLGARLMPGR